MSSPPQIPRTWLLLGASSSVARAFARHTGARGADVILAGRDKEDLERSAQDIKSRFGVSATAVTFDANDIASHAAFCKSLDGYKGPLGVFLVFGTMPEQTDMDDNVDLVIETVNVNYLGAVSVLSRLAERLEDDGAGNIVVMSSVAGDRGRLKNYIYGSAKAGLNTYLQGLRARLFRTGIPVTTVKAGFVDTDMTFGIPGMFLVATPEACAEACLTLAEKGRETAYFPWFWKYIMLIICLIPERIFKRLNI